MSKYVFFILLFFIQSVALAVDCDPCEPLAEVYVTNRGLEKIIEVSMNENLKLFNKTVRDRIGFKNLVLDKSNCPVQTISAAWKNRHSPDKCSGLIDLGDHFSIGGSTLLRPYKAEINNLKLNDIALTLEGPIKCEKFKCDFNVQVKKVNVDGQLKLNYTDKNEGFIPETPFNILASDQAHLKFSGQVLVDPKSGKLNDLVFLDEARSKVKVTPGSLNFNMKLKKPFTSKDSEIKMHANAFRKLIDLKNITSAEFIENQYSDILRDLEFKYRTENRSPSSSSLKEDLHLAQRSVQNKINADYGSEENFKKSLQNIKWPDANDDQAIDKFISNPPKEVLFFSKIREKMSHIPFVAQAENSGFTNYQAYMMATAATNLVNTGGSDPFVVDHIIEPLLQNEIVPIVQSEVNSHLRNMKQYWDQISKVPALDTQDLQTLLELQKKLSVSTDENEKTKLRREIIELTKKTQDNWLPIDTTVLIDQNTRQGQLLKSQIFKSLANCSNVPSRFPDEAETNFDVRTELGPQAWQTYFNELADKKNLNFCIDSSDQKNCTGGTKINFKKPPQISCENGQLNLELDADVAKSIFKADISGKVKAQIQNCSGDPCLQFIDSSGHFKNVILNTFFGSFLQRGLSNAVQQSSNMPVNIPFVKLQKLQTSPNDCKTKLDWEIRP